MFVFPKELGRIEFPLTKWKRLYNSRFGKKYQYLNFGILILSAKGEIDTGDKQVDIQVQNFKRSLD